MKTNRNYYRVTIIRSQRANEREGYEHPCVEKQVGVFETLEEAIAHANDSEAHTIKVYSPEGELQHIVTPETTETYA